jgi:hypothetical protein
VLADDKLGVIAAQLAFRFPDWIQRRIERVSYPDRSMTRWNVGVMIRWPKLDFFAGELRGGERIYVPLDLLTKDPLTGLDGRYPDGSPFPILPFQRSTELAASGITTLIWALCEETRKEPLSVESVAQIDAVVTAPPTLAKRLLAEVLRPNSTQLATVLSERSQFRGLLQELSKNVMFLAPATYYPETEVVYRYTYSRPLLSKDSWYTRAAAVLGLVDTTMKHPDLSLGWSHSYHFEVDAPAEVRITRARLWQREREDGHGKHGRALLAEAGGSPVVALHARRPTEDAIKDGQAANPDVRPPVLPEPPEKANAVQLLDAARRSQATPSDRADTGYARVRLRLDPAGTFFVATVVSCITALLLVGARPRLVRLDGQTAAALLLALPILTLGYLTRPGEHSLATRLLSIIRLAALVVGICSLLVAAILAGGFVKHSGGKSARYSCTSQIEDRSIKRAPRASWRTTADPDATRMSCANVPGVASQSSLKPAAQNVADVATWLAVGLAAMLLIGWLWTRVRSNGMLPEPEVLKVS